MDIHALQRFVREYYPFPIAHAHKKTLGVLDENLEKLKCLLETAEVTMQFLGLLALAQVRHDLLNDALPPLGRLREEINLTTPSFGKWTRLTRSIMKVYVQARDQQTSAYEHTINLELSNGRNKIQISVLNQQGAESLKETIEVEYTGKPVQPDLYIVVVGVSQYVDTRRNLKYADKDAADLVAFFQEHRQKFGNLHVKAILNADATREQILSVKEFLKPSKVDVAPDPAVHSRGLERLYEPSVGLQNSFELLRELFANLQRGTGAIVIAAASGLEYSYESRQYQNGLFTYAVLDGLRGQADANQDQKIQVSELQAYVTTKVQELTNNRQTPTIQRETLDFDFQVY